MIPKIIHYCWFGRGEKPQLIQDCIASWKKYCPDYEIIEWNEDNFDFSSCQYAREAYEAKKWAFVSDYVRLCVLNEYGGIYFDTDLELLKPIDKWINEAEGLLSFEARDFVCLGIIATNKNNELINDMIKEYESISFLENGNTLNMETNVRRMRKHLLKRGLKNNGKLQKVADFTILPQKYFFPCTFGMVFGKTPSNAYAVHHAASSWRDDAGKRKSSLRPYLVNKARNILGTDTIEKMKDLISGDKNK